jgi:hypothetical protein
MATVKSTVSMGDRFAEITVVTLTIFALLAGWFFKSSVENRAFKFEAEGISAQAPSGWLQAKIEGDEVLHVTDLSSSGFGTTYILRKLPVEADTVASEVVTLLTLEHGQNLTAFRVLDQHEVTVYGQPAYEVNYVFVESDPNLTHASLPSVVRGTDYIFVKGDQAVVATYWADEANFESDLNRFHLFLESLKF